MLRILVLLLLFAVESTALGQGRVRFSNTSSTLIWTNSTLGGPAAGPIVGSAGSYYFALFSASAGTVDPSAFTFTGAYATNTTSAGRLTGGDAEIPGATGGNSFALLVRGWSANIGHDYSAVTTYLANPTFDAWYGESSIGTIQPLTPEGPYPNLFGLNPLQIHGFTLEMHSAPEPSAFALLSLGVAMLWRSRRRSP